MSLKWSPECKNMLHGFSPRSPVTCGKYTFKTFIQVGWINAFSFYYLHKCGIDLKFKQVFIWQFDLICVAVQRKCTVQKYYDCCLCCSYRSTFPTNDLTPYLILLLGELQCMGLNTIVQRDSPLKLDLTVLRFAKCCVLCLTLCS